MSADDRRPLASDVRISVRSLTRGVGVVAVLAVAACAGGTPASAPVPTAASSPAPGSARAPDGAVAPVGVVARVVPRGKGGLLGVAVSPGFATDRSVFVASTSATDNRVVRLRVGGRWHDRRRRAAGRRVRNPEGHHPRRRRSRPGPDGLLYAGTGEAGRRGPAQDRADLGGKILRVTPDGAPAPRTSG